MKRFADTSQRQAIFEKLARWDWTHEAHVGMAHFY